MWAIITGSSLALKQHLAHGEILDRHTPFGDCASGLIRSKILEHDVLILPRHGLHNENLAHEINYRANIFALKRFGATKILSLSSVMSLSPKYKPGDLVVPSQYFNFAHAMRPHTFCGNGVVGHVSLLKPVSSLLLSRLQEIVPQVDYNMHFNINYVCVDGPHSPTLFEAKRYRELSADVIGFSHYPEYALVREAGMAYLPCCFVVDSIVNDTHSALLTPAHIKTIRADNQAKASQLTTLIINSLSNILPMGCPEEGLQKALMTAWDDLTEEQRSWLSILLDR